MPAIAPANAAEAVTPSVRFAEGASSSSSPVPAFPANPDPLPADEDAPSTMEDADAATGLQRQVSSVSTVSGSTSNNDALGEW